MLKLRNKLNKKGGFTLVEMLIVVAIIAILIAVSIPLITGALERTRQATDAANERAAKAGIMVAYLSGKLDNTNDFEVDKIYRYDAMEGKLTEGTVEAYGKCEDHKDKWLLISIDINGTVTTEWDDTATIPSTITDDGDSLCSHKINK